MLPNFTAMQPQNNVVDYSIEGGGGGGGGESCVFLFCCLFFLKIFFFSFFFGGGGGGGGEGVGERYCFYTVRKSASFYGYNGGLFFSLR